MRANLINLAVILAVLSCLPAVLCGCRSNHARGPLPMTAAADGIAGIIAHTESAERHVRSAIPHADPTGKVYLGAASDEHRQVLDDAAQTKAALLGAQQQIESLNSELAQQTLKHQRLESRWYVVWGRRIERALWIVGLTWLVLGVASIVLGMGNPLGWGVKLGKEIVRLIPAMNIFAWLRDWIVRRRQVGVSAGMI